MCPLKFCCAEINALFSSTGFQNEVVLFSAQISYLKLSTRLTGQLIILRVVVWTMDNFDLPHFSLVNYLLLVSVV